MSQCQYCTKILWTRTGYINHIHSTCKIKRQIDQGDLYHLSRMVQEKEKQIEQLRQIIEEKEKK